MKKIKEILNEDNNKLNIKDYLILIFIVLIYTIISFINLGNTISPNTFFKTESTNQVVIKL